MHTTLYLATGHGLAVITGSDREWTGSVHLEDKAVQCVAVDQAQRGVTYCGTLGDGLFRSIDSGVTWQRCSRFTNANVTALTVADSGVVYAGTEPSAMFRSDNGGATWEELSTLVNLPSATHWSYPPRPDTHHVRFILPDKARPSRLHVAVEAGALLCSDDLGRTWRDRVPSGPMDTHSLTVSGQDPTRLYSAAGDGFFESIDDGDSWRRFTDGLEHQYCWSVAVSIASPPTIMLSASQRPLAAHSKDFASPSIYRRTGNGSWREMQEHLAEVRKGRIAILKASRIEPKVFYLSAEGAIHRSADDGLRWSKLPIRWDGSRKADHALDMALIEEV